MKIAVLTHKDVGGHYAAALMERGHEVTINGGDAIYVQGLKPFLECDGCLLIGNEDDLLEIAQHLEVLGKKVWHQLTEVPTVTQHHEY